MNPMDVKKEYEKGHCSKPEYIEKMYQIHAVLFQYSEFIKNTDIRQIEIMDDEVIMTTRASGIKMITEFLDQRTAPIEILNFGGYESDLLTMCHHLIDESSTIFDVGGNAGWYTINFAKSIKNAKLYVFEPLPKTFDLLQRNLQLNKIEDVHLFNHGLSNEEEDLIFYYYPDCSANASMADLTHHEGTTKITCQVKRLDDVVAAEKISVDFIKVDVEGAELFVFQGALETLQRDQPIVFSEMLRKWSGKFHYHPNEILALFDKIGYRCFTVKNDGLEAFLSMDENTLDTNFIFLHEEKHAKKIQKYCLR